MIEPTDDTIQIALGLPPGRVSAATLRRAERERRKRYGDPQQEQRVAEAHATVLHMLSTRWQTNSFTAIAAVVWIDTLDPAQAQQFATALATAASAKTYRISANLLASGLRAMRNAPTQAGDQTMCLRYHPAHRKAGSYTIEPTVAVPVATDPHTGRPLSRWRREMMSKQRAEP